ncbi:LysR family transcriptional regulator [Cupriavidus necator H16]|uniref:LysR family transcriptional regulator n=1 Tax=Cupriavidus necator (strain ATCC 17699 / DSM 428 / KCTC 22496 / NCIMB 10442 / H16 / Stanier 337) TaxID=381666 RepID=Q0KAH5_CUPNH|nr:LysR family transcriptional regulator [Cupriavidus necator]QCC00834.1 LysR family transcriptional regulator [Cupriavidus necator H16]QQB76335.1 LysR family transcriptional regulator [Cupriavidus necator]WKA39203.1 LysR family transcriptional regulator [Cupriavidus necator]CAJ92996.1 transcriptional regulator, LysR-family [Cupriavidus necator H16]
MKALDAQIRLFLAIAQARSISGAAMTLGLTQSGLSRQLAHLEAAVGQKLCERHGRGVALTDAGHKLQAAAQTAYDVIDNTILLLCEEQGVSQGNLRVAVIHTLSYYFMPDVVSRFMSQRPNANVSLMGRSSPEVVELVETGKADIGFVYDVAVASDAVEIVPLFDDVMTLIVSQNSPLAALEGVDLEAQRVPLVAFPEHYALRRMLHRKRLDTNVVAEVDTVDAMLRLVASTGGQCVLPDRVPTQLLENYGLSRVRIINPRLSRRVVAITKRERAQTALIKHMLKIAQTV